MTREINQGTKGFSEDRKELNTNEEERWNEMKKDRMTGRINFKNDEI